MTTDFASLVSDGTPEGTVRLGGEDRAVVGQEFLWSAPASSAGVPVTHRSALGLTSIFASVNCLSSDLACIPLKVYQLTGEDVVRERRDHAAWPLLNLSPDGKTTAVRFRQHYMGHALTRGNGLAEIQRTGRGRPYALHILESETTRPKWVGDELWYTLGGPGDRALRSENVLHVAGLGHDGLWGYDLIRLAATPIGIALAADTSAASFFGNGAEPGGVIQVPKRLSDDAQRNLRESWADRHQGPYRRNRPAILEEGAEWKGTSTDPEKSQLLETRKHSVVDTARIWRTPPHKIGDFSQAHLANIEASNLDYIQTALLIWVVSVEQECTLKLLTESERAEGYFIAFDLAALQRGDMKARGEFYRTLRDLGVFSPNDIARREHLNPIPEGGDLRLVPLNMAPLETYARQAEGEAEGQGGPPAKGQAPAEPGEPEPEGDATPPPAKAPGAGPVTLTAATDPIFDLKRLLNDVAMGELPAETVKAVVLASYPFAPEQVDAMLAPLAGFSAASRKAP